MNELRFKWLGSTRLNDELTKPLSRISFEFEPHGWPMRVTLWHVDGTGLRMQSDMHDIRERIEVGVLCFELASEPKDGEVILELDPDFSELKVKRLIISESGIKADSGLLIRSKEGREISIVASSHPYMLAVQGAMTRPHVFEPEYPLDQYEVVAVN